MKVILTRDVPKVGRDGEIVTVADGYARNYLFPRSLAFVAKGAVIKQHANRVAREEAKVAALLATAQENGEKLREQNFQMMGKASPKSTRLFGAITEADVAEIIQKNLGIEVDKRRISLIDPIKTTGHYDLTARLHTDVVIPFSIDVVTQEQLDAAERAKMIAEEKAKRETARLEAEAAEAAAERERREAERQARIEAGEEEAVRPRRERPLISRSEWYDAPDAEG